MTAAADIQDLSAAVAEVLADADADIAARKPLCRASGNCCKFEQHGHRLYVTAAELIHFAHTHAPAIENQKLKIENTHRLSLPQFFAQPAPTGCPYQVDNLCTAREARPLGCRIYFCDANAQSWQNDVYEKYHRRLRELHDRFAVAYRYLEWRAALRELLPENSAVT
jgi:Fe-S-cluster containining protein